jgi:hypothetical protein
MIMMMMTTTTTTTTTGKVDLQPNMEFEPFRKHGVLHIHNVRGDRKRQQAYGIRLVSNHYTKIFSLKD